MARCVWRRTPAISTRGSTLLHLRPRLSYQEQHWDRLLTWFPSQALECRPSVRPSPGRGAQRSVGDEKQSTGEVLVAAEAALGSRHCAMSQPAPLDVKKAEKKLWLIKVSGLLCDASVHTVLALRARLRHRCPSTWRSSGRPHLQMPLAPEGALGQSWAVCASPLAHRHVSFACCNGSALLCCSSYLQLASAKPCCRLPRTCSSR